MRQVFISIITAYQKILSPDQGAVPRALGVSRTTCIFYPSCSAYAKEAFLLHGSAKGLVLTSWRLLRCHPFRPPGIDPVPKIFKLPFITKVR